MCVSLLGLLVCRLPPRARGGLTGRGEHGTRCSRGEISYVRCYESSTRHYLPRVFSGLGTRSYRLSRNQHQTPILHAYLLLFTVAVRNIFARREATSLRPLVLLSLLLLSSISQYFTAVSTTNTRHDTSQHNVSHTRTWYDSTSIWPQLLRLDFFSSCIPNATK